MPALAQCPPRPGSVGAPATAPLRRHKVLHFIPRIGGGGAENFLRSLVAAMRDSPWQNVIITVRVHPHEAFAADLEALGCVVHDLNASALLKPSVWTAVRRLIRLEDPDVVQTWMHHADFLGGMAAWSAGCHNIVWGVRATAVHRNPEDSALKTVLFRLALGVSAKFLPRKIIANSTAAIAVHEAMGYPPDRFVWVPNGVNAGRFAPRPEVATKTRNALQLPAEAPVIGFAGRFHPVKDLALFFDAAAMLQTQRPDVHFVLVGGTEGALYPEARSAFEKLPHPGQVRFVPFAPAMEQYYPAFTVFTLCSESEAFPNVLLEAMACGVPCAATAAGDCAAMLDGLGPVVPVHDRQALLEAWLHLLSLTEAERAALGARGRERALQDYSMERAARRFQEVYEALLA